MLAGAFCVRRPTAPRRPRKATPWRSRLKNGLPPDDGGQTTQDRRFGRGNPSFPSSVVRPPSSVFERIRQLCGEALRERRIGDAVVVRQRVGGHVERAEQHVENGKGSGEI